VCTLSRVDTLELLPKKVNALAYLTKIYLIQIHRGGAQSHTITQSHTGWLPVAPTTPRWV